MSYITTIIFIIFYLLSLVASLHAIRYARTPESAIAWSLSLITFPYISFPLYLIFGRRKFQGYVNARREKHPKMMPLIRSIISNSPKSLIAQSDHFDMTTLEKLVGMPASIADQFQLLINADAAYYKLFEMIDQSQSYILFQTYILRDDELGIRLRKKLAEARYRGVEIFLLYDEIGSYELSNQYLQSLRALGITVHPFHSTKGRKNRFQVNFRNHRKLAIMDGREA